MGGVGLSAVICEAFVLWQLSSNLLAQDAQDAH